VRSSLSSDLMFSSNCTSRQTRETLSPPMIERTYVCSAKLDERCNEICVAVQSLRLDPLEWFHLIPRMGWNWLDTSWHFLDYLSKAQENAFSHWVINVPIFEPLWWGFLGCFRWDKITKKISQY
jgi:hypothetical protein